jgi:hypothetical protein
MRLPCPKGHLAKAGHYLTARYVLCDSNGQFYIGKAQRGHVVTLWEIRYGFLDIHHFSLSNTDGDSGKTAIINAAGMAQLRVLYCDLARCPYPANGKRYAFYEGLFNGS